MHPTEQAESEEPRDDLHDVALLKPPLEALGHDGLPSVPRPSISPARSPPQLEFDDEFGDSEFGDAEFDVN